MDDANDEWSLATFGHGAFQRCGLVAKIYQIDTLFEQSPIVLIADQPITIGILMTPPEGFEGPLDSFIKQVIRNAGFIEVTYTLLHDSSDVLLETNYAEALRKSNQKDEDTPKKFYSTQQGVLLVFRTMLKVARIYNGLPLLIVITLNLTTVQGYPFNRRLVMDKNEMDVRLLLDLNRYQPPRVPNRSIDIPLRIIHPVLVEPMVRELNPISSIICLAIKNEHPSMAIVIHNIVLHLERTTIDERGHRNSSSFSGTTKGSAMFNSSVLDHRADKRTSRYEDLFTIKLLLDDQPTNLAKANCNFTPLFGNVLMIQPCEAHSVIYKIAPHLLTDSATSTDASTGYFITPCTIYWSPVTQGSCKSKDGEVDVLKSAMPGMRKQHTADHCEQDISESFIDDEMHPLRNDSERPNNINAYRTTTELAAEVDNNNGSTTISDANNTAATPFDLCYEEISYYMKNMPHLAQTKNQPLASIAFNDSGSVNNSNGIGLKESAEVPCDSCSSTPSEFYVKWHINTKANHDRLPTKFNFATPDIASTPNQPMLSAMCSTITMLNVHVSISDSIVSKHAAFKVQVSITNTSSIHLQQPVLVTQRVSDKASWEIDPTGCIAGQTHVFDRVSNGIIFEQSDVGFRDLLPSETISISLQAMAIKFSNISIESLSLSFCAMLPNSNRLVRSPIIPLNFTPVQVLVQ